MFRAHNFSAGPAALPTEVLEKAHSEFLNYKGIGASIMEVSHRGKEFDPIMDSVRARLRRLMGLSDQHKIMFLHGGATHQFCMIPMNFLRTGDKADFIDTGIWSHKAIKESTLYGDISIPYSSESTQYDRVPSSPTEISFRPDAKFVHYTSNNTIYGTQFLSEPNTNGIPLICDASSDFLSRPINIDAYSMIYAGAQKNLGPSGVAVVIIHEDFLKTAYSDDIPTYMKYLSHAGELFHTPPTYAIYLVDLVLEWLEQKGGVSAIEIINNEKARLLYQEIDKDDFYESHAQIFARSKMNVLFKIKNKELESAFIKQSESEHLMGLKAHRTTGGLRASLYNAVSLETAKTF